MATPTAPDPADTTGWERRAQLVVDYAPLVLLAVGFGLAMTFPQSPRDRVTAVLLTLVAAAWMTAFLVVPALRNGRGQAALLYMAGFLAIASLLMLHNPLFFPVMVGGFFHAHAVRPWPLTLLVVAVTSFLLNTLVAQPPPDPSVVDVVIYAFIILIQTLGIGAGVVIGQKTTDLLAERRRTVAELQAALEENAGLHAQLMVQAREAGVLDERQRLAQEIHDTLAQGLTGIIAQLQAASRAGEDAAARQRHLDTALQLSRDSLADARRSVQALTPEPLDGARLPDAVAQVARRWADHSGVPAEVATTGTPQRLHPAVEVTLLRVTQEALANVARHAQASKAVVTLSYLGDVVTLDVSDDGVGFDPSRNGGPSAAGGFGLGTMRRRLDEVGGTLTLESEVGGGTTINAAVPVVRERVPLAAEDSADG
ncbi:MAG TPA: sensor histidine kinase [Egibacteraceae bacterium]